MRARPPAVAFSASFFAVVIVLGLVLGAWLAVLGFGVPVAISTLIVLGVVQLTEEQRRAKANRIRQALLNCNIGIRQAARIMEYSSHADFERALSGERKLDVWRLAMLGIEFEREYNVLALADSGLPERFQKFLEMAPALPFIPSDKRSA